MPTDPPYVMAQSILDSVPNAIVSDSHTPIEAKAQIATGWALLALVDEVEALRKALDEQD